MEGLLPVGPTPPSFWSYRQFRKMVTYRINQLIRTMLVKQPIWLLLSKFYMTAFIDLQLNEMSSYIMGRAMNKPTFKVSLFVCLTRKKILIFLSNYEILFKDSIKWNGQRQTEIETKKARHKQHV